MALTSKQAMFVVEYLVDLNASAACLRAGYKSKNPDIDGHKLLVSPSISKAIQEEMTARANRTLITADYVLKGIKGIADAGEKETDKLKAFELLGKHLKLFTDKVEASGPNGNAIEINVNVIDDD